MDEALAFMLRAKYLFIGAPLTGIGRDGLANERPEFRTVVAHIEHALGAFVRCIAQYRIDAVVVASAKRVKVFLQLIGFHEEHISR